MQPEELCLYVDARFISPYGLSAFVAMHEKGLRFEVRTVDLLANQQQGSGYAASSLTRRVPTLIYKGFALSESSAIAEYVNEVFEGPPLYPTDSRARSRARQVQAWLRSDLESLRKERASEFMFLGWPVAPLSAGAQAEAERLFFAAQSLLSTDEHLFGTWCIADVDLACMLNRLILCGDVVPDRLVGYAARQWQRPSVQLWLDRVHRPA
jgi:glutathione S-transferase